MDGDKDLPTICGTGTENCFCASYCFPESYVTPYAGAIKHRSESGLLKRGLYCWHIPDAIAFDTDLRVTIQTLGWWPDQRCQPLQEDTASVAYWCQEEPHAPFPAFPFLPARRPR